MERPALVLACGLLLAFAAPVSAAAQTIGAEPSRGWGELERVDELLDAGRWKRAERMVGELRERVMSGGWRSPDLGQLLTEVDYRIAIVAAERGDEERAVWEWHAALALERHAGGTRSGVPLAERDLSARPRAAELFAAHPLRAAGEYPPGHAPVEIRPDRPFEPATAPPFEPAPLANASATREAVAPVQLEVFVDRQGVPSQPVVLTDWSHPVVVQWALDSLRASPRFEPATLDGEPIGWLVPVELTLAGQDPKRW